MSANRSSQQKLTVRENPQNSVNRTSKETPRPSISDLWYKNAIIYCRRAESDSSSQRLLLSFVIRVFTASSNCRDPTTYDYRRPDPHSASRNR